MSEEQQTEKVEDSSEAEPAGATDDRSTFLGRVQSAWRQTVGTYATDEGETRNLFGRLVDFGNITGEEAKKLLNETQGRIEQNRKELEDRVDASLKRAVPRLSVPSADEIDDLNRKVDDIEKRIAALEQ
jgi:poly(hydroxyalkanoate) granule-associated protein